MNTHQNIQDPLKTKQFSDFASKFKIASKNVTFLEVKSGKYEVNQSNRYCTQDSLSDGEIVQIQGEQQSNIEEQSNKKQDKLEDQFMEPSSQLSNRLDLKQNPQMEQQITEQTGKYTQLSKNYETMMKTLTAKEQQIQIMKQANIKLSQMVKQTNRKYKNEKKQVHMMTKRKYNNKSKLGQDEREFEEDLDDDLDDDGDDCKGQKGNVGKNQERIDVGANYRQVYQGIAWGVIVYLIIAIVGIFK